MKKASIAKIKQSISGKSVNQIVKTVCGELIGSGVHRDVYVLKADQRYVIKIERDPSKGQFANVTEWRNYIDNKDWKFLSEWLAPCLMINETGQVLIQQRVNRDGKCRKDYPMQIPEVFTDLKYKNFGWIGDRFVCCDYSYFRIHSKTVKAKWWGTLKK